MPSCLISFLQGKAEEAVKALDFERTCVYRPGLLMCDRQESRAGEKLFRCLAGAVDKSEKYSIPTEKVAKAMLVNSLRSVIHGLKSPPLGQAPILYENAIDDTSTIFELF